MPDDAKTDPWVPGAKVWSLTTLKMHTIRRIHANGNLMIEG